MRVLLLRASARLCAARAGEARRALSLAAERASSAPLALTLLRSLLAYRTAHTHAPPRQIAAASTYPNEGGVLVLDDSNFDAAIAAQ